MKGFKDFLMQGNIVDLAVAVIIGAAFGRVVEAFTKLIMDFIGLVGGEPDFSQVTIPYININIGVFITAVVSFLIVSASVYFLVIKPFTAVKERFTKQEEAAAPAPSTEDLLAEIRDLLKAQKES